MGVADIKLIIFI